VEGVHVAPRERERRLAKRRADRSHRRRGLVVRPGRRPPPWTLGEKAALVINLAFIVAGMVLTVVVFLPGSTVP
jgi:hypothetical protein